MALVGCAMRTATVQFEIESTFGPTQPSVHVEFAVVRTAHLTRFHQVRYLVKFYIAPAIEISPQVMLGPTGSGSLE